MKQEITRRNLDRLQSDYLNLTKAGESSLRAAWEFGNTVADLHRYYAYADLGEAIGRSGATVSLYHRLYERYGHPDILVDVAKELGTYDVSKLAADEHSEAATRVLGHCATCGSWNVKKERVPLEEAAKIVQMVKAVQTA